MFEGHDGRECGEHRTTGLRAWCFACSEWCYPDDPCKGCEVPSLRARVAELEGLLVRTQKERNTRIVELEVLLREGCPRVWNEEPTREQQIAETTRQLEWWQRVTRTLDNQPTQEPT